MLKTDAIKFYGTRAAVAKAAGVDPSAVSQWGILVPEGRALRLQDASSGKLSYNPAIYDEYRKTKREKGMSRENQS